MTDHHHEYSSNATHVRIYGSQWNDCGYCKGRRAAIVGREANACSKAFHILVANHLSPAQYEEFVNQGWRRCGVSIYKPENWVSCCPQISIRLPVKSFLPSKSQKKVIKKMEAALRTPNESKSKKQVKQKDDRISTIISTELRDSLAMQVRAVLLDVLKGQTELNDLLPKKIEFKERHHPNKNDTTVIILATPVCAAIAGKSKGMIDRGQLCTQVADALGRIVTSDPSYPNQAKKRSHPDEEDNLVLPITKVEPHVKSGQILAYVQINDGSTAASLTSNGEATPMEEDPTDRLAQWWARQRPSQPLADERNLAVTTLPAHESALDPAVYRLYALYQHKVHGDADPFTENVDEQEEAAAGDPWNDEWGKRAPKGWKVKLRQVLEDNFRSLSLARRNHLVRHYLQFYEFLVDNSYPLENTKQGTFHQQYRVNGVLIAVGVVDVLPQGLSSVYVFYDPDFCQSVAPLGKYTVLREIQWAQEHQLPYYYLGYYIESCGKMRYKADYAPSELLCPRTAIWVPAAKAQRLIQEKSPERHCCAFVPENTVTISRSIPPNLQLEVGFGRVITWQELPSEATSVLEPFVTDFCQEAGPLLAEQLVLDFR